MSVAADAKREHGTSAGYWQHFRRGEPICTACREAYRAKVRQRRAQNPHRARQSERAKAQKTRALATRTNRAWTAEEDAIVLGEGTEEQKALMLGRSSKAVRHRKAYLRNPPPPKPPRILPTCSAEGCDRQDKKTVRGMCSMHYARFKKYGTPNPHGLNRLGCDCDECTTAREQREAEISHRRRIYARKRSQDPNRRRHQLARLREKYQTDEDYRQHVLQRGKEQREKRLEQDPHIYAEYSRRWKRENPEKALELQRRTVALRRERNTLSLPEAHNHFKEWTGPELEMVCRDDLSIAELAVILGRTLVSVQHARKKARSLPREVLLAGVAQRQLVRQHGTNAGYWQHYKRGEEICGACRKAHQDHSRNRYHARRGYRSATSGNGAH